MTNFRKVLVYNVENGKITDLHEEIIFKLPEEQDSYEFHADGYWRGSPMYNDALLDPCNNYSKKDLSNMNGFHWEEFDYD